MLVHFVESGLASLRAASAVPGRFRTMIPDSRVMRASCIRHLKPWRRANPVDKRLRDIVEFADAVSLSAWGS